MAQLGNKQNSYLNGEWATHGRPHGKKLGSKRRRRIGKALCWLWNAAKERKKGR